MSSVNVRDSRKDLISVDINSNPQTGPMTTFFKSRSSSQRAMVGGLVVSCAVSVGLLVALIVVSNKEKSQLEKKFPKIPLLVLPTQPFLDNQYTCESVQYNCLRHDSLIQYTRYIKFQVLKLRKRGLDPPFTHKKKCFFSGRTTKGVGRHGPQSHQCREGKTLVIRPLKKLFFYVCLS